MGKHKEPTKTKITARLDKEVVTEFNSAIIRLGLRRDTYLNRVLPAEVSYLNNLPVNSVSGELNLRNSRSSNLVKLGISLDTNLVNRVNAACDTKRIPRDVFFEECIRFLTKSLHAVDDALENPRNHWPDEGAPYRELIWTDEEAEQWGAGVTALARLKGITFDQAQSALLEYSKADREKILSSENVKKLEKEIRAGSGKAQPVSLDDLLTPLRNRK